MAVSLPRFLLRKAIAVLVVCLAASALTFVSLHALRPDAFDDPRPMPTKLLDYLQRAFLHLDLGRSRVQGRPVSDLIAEGLPADVSLVTGAVVFGLLAGAVGGTMAARDPGSRTARALDALATLAMCAPVYVVGLGLILLFGPGISTTTIDIPLLATNVYEPLSSDPVRWLQSLLVPWMVTGAPLAGICMRMTRGSMRDALDADYIRTAVAKGLGPVAVAFRHVLPVALSPTLSTAGAYLPLLIGNALLVERVFSIPGVFRSVPRATEFGDFPLLMGLVVVTAVFVVVANGLVDVLLVVLDPRLRAAGV